MKLEDIWIPIRNEIENVTLPDVILAIQSFFIKNEVSKEIGFVIKEKRECNCKEGDNTDE